MAALFTDMYFTFCWHWICQLSVFSSSAFLCWGSFSEISKHGGGKGDSVGENDDYAYPPPPVPAYSLSLSSTPVLYKKGASGGHSRNIRTPGRNPICPGMNPRRVHTAPSSPATQRSTRQLGVNTLPTPGRQLECQTGLQKRNQEEHLNSPSMLHYPTAPCHNGSHNQPKQFRNEQWQQPKHHQPPELSKQCSVEELRSTVQTLASSIEHGTHDVRHLGQKMVAATEMITDSVEENAQALNLLAEVVNKLQGLIVASKHPQPSHQCGSKRHPPPPPPPRVSSLSPKVVRKTPTPYPHHLSPSSSSCSSSSSTSLSSCADSFAASISPKGVNGGSRKMVVASGATQTAGGSGSNGQIRLNNGTVSRAPLEVQQDCNSTGCLTNKKKKNK